MSQSYDSSLAPLADLSKARSRCESLSLTPITASATQPKLITELLHAGIVLETRIGVLKPDFPHFHIGKTVIVHRRTGFARF